jgi:hypothetical protein
METKHTPGPWTLDAQYPDEIVGCDGKRRIGEVYGGRFVGDCSDPQYEIPAEVLANARLFAAAPELLEALELCKRVLFAEYMDEKAENRTGMATSAWLRAEAASRTARGGEQ